MYKLCQYVFILSPMIYIFDTVYLSRLILYKFVIQINIKFIIVFHKILYTRNSEFFNNIKKDKTVYISFAMSVAYISLKKVHI